ncbi:hypothetical protein [Saccharothrix longispora]|uniref:hypothetical protein n=1 Tax=Saccharothrix longispora TaxID=33920 RepID=UPI0028FDB766|nr:hypothetical protein [Saccharothrix longispora]MDU0289318.1 hypothetical protein [Saccharothrix longispora]
MSSPCPVHGSDNPNTLLGTADGLLLPHGVLDDLVRLPGAVYQRAHDAPVTGQLSTLGFGRAADFPRKQQEIHLVKDRS